MARKLKAVAVVEPLKLDLGCGKQKQTGFIGVDRNKYDSVDVVHDLLKPWPWGNDTVVEIWMSHTLEHFTGRQRPFIFNEMYRVLIPDGKATIITPLWSSNRAYGDFTHEWPPVSEMLYYYLNKKWRDDNAPDNDVEWNKDGYNCNFDATWGYSGMHPTISTRNDEAKMFALSFYKEAAFDLQATLIKK